MLLYRTLNAVLARVSVATTIFVFLTFLRTEFGIAINIMLHREESLTDYGRLTSSIPSHAPV
jgi:Mg2+ and Co2+ transporter CorA